MEPSRAAEVIRRSVADEKAPLTVADASVASGLALRDAEAGLNWLTSEYRGHLRVTEDGDLVHFFPHGFTKPWQTRETTLALLSAIGGALAGAGRFIVRAWLLVVMVAYAAVFLALLVGATFARQSGSDSRHQGPSLPLAYALVRMIGDALFWTFHPFSPLSIERRSRRALGDRRGRAEPKIAFYEKVNRFVFGPPQPKEDPHEARSRVLREIRAQRGRVSLADVMRVTGLPRAEADPLMARLMLDHDGTVDVSEGGGIVYRFESLRRSAEGPASSRHRPRAAWAEPPELPPLTGNSPGANAAIALLNGFNLLASAWAIKHHLTLRNLALLFDPERPPVLAAEGVPIVLGVIPFVFSLALFVLPIARAIHRLRQERRVAEERARLGVLREVVTHAERREPVTDEALRAVVRVATGDEPSSEDITKRVVELGGDVDIGPEGEVRYRFAELEADEAAAREERARASEEEARLGRVIFATDH